MAADEATAAPTPTVAERATTTTTVRGDAGIRRGCPSWAWMAGRPPREPLWKPGWRVGTHPRWSKRPPASPPRAAPHDRRHLSKTSSRVSISCVVKARSRRTPRLKATNHVSHGGDPVAVAGQEGDVDEQPAQPPQQALTASPVRPRPPPALARCTRPSRGRRTGMAVWLGRPDTCRRMRRPA